MAHELFVISPEKTVLTYRLAGFGSRAFAQVLDILVILALLLMIVMASGLFFGFGAVLTGAGEISLGIGTIVMALVLTLGPFLYFILFEWLWNGQTLGKKGAGIRVRMADGTPITFAAAVGRNLLRIADLLPGTYFVGLIAMFTNPKAQRIGDLFAGTIVLRERKLEARFRPAPHVEEVHPLEDHVGDLRGMTSEDYWALRRLCDRFPELPKSVQDRMIGEVWNPISRRLAVPEQANVHPLYWAEAVVMKYGRIHGML